MRLRDWPASARLGLSLLLLVLLGGLVASGFYVQEHHSNRDERPGLSLDDLEGAYHGIDVRAPLLVALEGGHPAEMGAALGDEERARLLEWLGSPDVSRGYDDIDLGDFAPAEILAAACVGCHSRRGEDEAARELPLEGWEDVRPLAHSRSVQATDPTILLASTHAHALSLACISIVCALLLFATRWSGAVRGWLVLAMGLGLFVDLGSWWLARDSAAFVPLIAVAGALYALATAATTLAVLLDLWMPKRPSRE